jgi:LPXTG-motif cell wall-anchored protein
MTARTLASGIAALSLVGASVLGFTGVASAQQPVYPPGGQGQGGGVLGDNRERGQRGVVDDPARSGLPVTRRSGLPLTGSQELVALGAAGGALVAIGAGVVVVARRRREELPAGLA